MNIFTVILAATLPTAIYSLFIWWLDRYEKEPLWLIVVAFFWGSIPAIGLSLLFELGLELPLAASPIGPDVAAWGLAPVVEEPIKALALVGLFLFMRHEFDGVLDGIVYGSLVGFGFSMTENLLYFFHYSANLGALFWVRSIFFGLNHAFFTSLVGMALGAVRYHPVRWLRIGACALGLALAIIFHALHNLATHYHLPGLIASWIVQWSGVLVVLAIAILSWRNERQWIEQELREEVSTGLLSSVDYAEISSPARRMQRQLHTLLNQGWASYWRVRQLHHLATKLAFCKTQLKLADQRHTCDERDQLRSQISDLRAAIERDEQLWGQA
ncbi:MAG: PrsW family intramembrane metalloprotease [Chloroflexi bacterium SZAS-1]|jgi:RsiW-degrading membrane proteinase PrsW (M82 family)|nr:PrsW family intramembrane metalloprotease [Chloroflexi bacterium SZAS-1]HNP84497.1 PrsW family intramembrane metalloprotease [Kouleothrix sp.]